jgi:hypothetical protein
MIIIKSINWLWSFIKDKVIHVAFLFTKSDELSSYKEIKEYSENFLNNFNHQEKTRKIWLSLFNEKMPVRQKDISKIYRLNFTFLSDLSLKRVQYYIDNHFWSLLDYFEIDTWNWRDQDIFESSSLITYLIITNNGLSILILTELHEGKYEVIKTYYIKRIPLWKLKSRKLVYSSEKGFLSI